MRQSWNLLFVSIFNFWDIYGKYAINLIRHQWKFFVHFCFKITKVTRMMFKIQSKSYLTCYKLWKKSLDLVSPTFSNNIPSKWKRPISCNKSLILLFFAHLQLFNWQTSQQEQLTHKSSPKERVLLFTSTVTWTVPKDQWLDWRLKRMI